MSDRTYRAICFITAIAFTLLSINASQADRPNVLILYADDLGHGDLRFLNPKSKIPAPNLERLAQEGMVFTDGHSSSGICTPSRYSLLTGRHHWRKFHGIVNAFGESVIDADRLTMPEMFKARGYSTAAIGKWHLGWDWPAIRKPNAKPQKSGRRAVYSPEAFDWSKPIPDGPLAHGFDYYFGDTVINFPPYCWIENDRVVNVPDVMMETAKWKPIKEGSWECRPGPMFSGWDPYQNIPTTTDKAVEYIIQQAKSDSQFFLYFAFPSPHAPIIPNDQFDGKSGAGAYGDFVYETDDACGRILSALQDSGQADSTVVIFTADNGPERYAYKRDQVFDHWSAEPFRGLKRDIYEGGHHVPFVIKWPGYTEAGRVCNDLVSQIDLMATLAAALDFELPDNAAEDSHDLLPLIKGEGSSPRDTHVHNTRAETWAIRVGEWNLILGEKGYHSSGYEDWEKKRGYPADDTGEVELYHYVKDPGQRRNLASKHPEKVAELKKALADARDRGHTAPRLRE